MVSMTTKHILLAAVSAVAGYFARPTVDRLRQERAARVAKQPYKVTVQEVRQEPVQAPEDLIDPIVNELGLVGGGGDSAEMLAVIQEARDRAATRGVDTGLLDLWLANVDPRDAPAITAKLVELNESGLYS